MMEILDEKTNTVWDLRRCQFSKAAKQIDQSIITTIHEGTAYLAEY